MRAGGAIGSSAASFWGPSYLEKKNDIYLGLDAPLDFILAVAGGPCTSPIRPGVLPCHELMNVRGS
jgi:hypothetical protein